MPIQDLLVHEAGPVLLEIQDRIHRLRDLKDQKEY
jgi:hypothetical protein